MSVREYGEETFGVLFTDAMMAEAVKRSGEDYEPEEYSAFADEIGLDELFSFSGQAYFIGEDGATDWSKEEMLFCDDHVYYAQLRKWSTLFKPAYSSMDEVIAELKEAFGKYLPDDFDYAHSIKHFVGTYYG